jgi:hypothetical protein
MELSWSAPISRLSLRGLTSCGNKTLFKRDVILVTFNSQALPPGKAVDVVILGRHPS